MSSYLAIVLSFFITILLYGLFGLLLGVIVSATLTFLSVPFDTLMNLGDKFPVLLKWMMSIIVPVTGGCMAWGVFFFFYSGQHKLNSEEN